MLCFFFFKQKTAYEMRISDWSSDVCSSDLITHAAAQRFCCRSLFRKALVSAVVDHCRGLEILVLKIDLARHQATARLQCLDGNWQAVEQRIRGQLIATEAQKPPAGLDPGGIIDGNNCVGAVGGRDLHNVAAARGDRSEAHTSELQSLMRISY